MRGMSIKEKKEEEQLGHFQAFFSKDQPGIGHRTERAEKKPKPQWDRK